MKIYKVKQNLISNPITDVPAAVAAQLDRVNPPIRSGARIAITAGSRGICNLAAMTRAAGDWVKVRGGEPFLVPCMGSHNGATAQGQRAMVESLGLTEEAMQMPIHSSMDVVELGEVQTGKVYMDRNCFESDGVIVLNRIKLHTCFTGPLQSGLTKMMVVGMGKIQSATTFHSTPIPQMATMLQQMGQVILDSGKILAGLAILEDGYDQTAEIHGVAPQEILEKETLLVEKHREYFPALPVEKLDVLIVDEIGKTYSGTGMDINVIGRRGWWDYPEPETPRIRVIGLLNLSAKSQGNAIGIGLADFITQRLRDAIDEEKMRINVLTTAELARGKIPLTLPDDKALIETIAGRFGEGRWLFIPNTLHLEMLYASEQVADQLREHPRCEVVKEGQDLTFEDNMLRLWY